MQTPFDATPQTDAAFTVRDGEPHEAEALHEIARSGSARLVRPVEPAEAYREPENGVLRVAVNSAGVVVGAQWYEQLDRNQCWLSGLIVHPDYRRSGVGGTLLDDAVRIARQDRMLTLRYVTEAGNDAVHQLSLERGLRSRGAWLDFQRVLDADACSLGRHRMGLGTTTTVKLQPSDRQRVLSLLTAAGRTLYVRSGTWHTLDDGAVARLIEEGKAFFSRSGVGGWGLAVIGTSAPGAFEATVVGTDPGCAKSLLEHLRALACASTVGVTLTIHTPQDAPIASLLATAVRRGEWHTINEHPLRVWELSLLP